MRRASHEGTKTRRCNEEIAQAYIPPALKGIEGNGVEGFIPNGVEGFIPKPVEGSRRPNVGASA
jgi:hypothetical protein